MFGCDAFGMELDTMNLMLFVTQPHDQTIPVFRRDFKAIGQGCAINNQ